MARAPRKTASLTSSTNIQLERQARRISRQQKQLEKELINEMSPMKLTGAASRSIKKTDLKKITPLTDNQEAFFESYDDGVEAFVLMGSAGTGKSFIGMALALRDILADEPQYDKLILIRSFVASRDIGFLPGTMEEKGQVYELQFQEIVNELIGRKEAYSKLKETGRIEFHPSSFLRGLTFDNCIIIVEEAQNMTWQELSTIATRIGKNSKVIFCCDIAQNDLVQKKSDVSGIRDFIAVTKNMPEFRHIRFTPEDIVRSGFVKSFITNCERLGL